MAYTKKTWDNGDAITPTNLNNMEDGIADIHYRIQSGTTAALAITANVLLIHTVTLPHSMPSADYSISALPLAGDPSVSVVSCAARSANSFELRIKSTTTFAVGAGFRILWTAIHN